MKYTAVENAYICIILNNCLYVAHSIHTILCNGGKQEQRTKMIEHIIYIVEEIDLFIIRV